MIGDFIARILVLLLGYAYPAFECYKTVEKNKVNLEELRFWCQYWIIVALLTACERFADIFFSWLPMYGEAKLAFVIYLWYPKTKGTAYIYDVLLRPFMAKHETEIDRKLLELKARAWDFALHYWQHCTTMGHTSFFQALQYLAAQSGKFTSNVHEKSNDPATPRAPPPSDEHPSNPSTPRTPGRYAPSAPPPPPSPTKRGAYESPRSLRARAHINSHAEAVRESDGDSSDKLLEARLKLRRSNSKPL